MSEELRGTKWLDKFLSLVQIENPELVELYHNQIFMVENASGEKKVAFDDLSELYATKEQIKKMRELFEEYFNTNPI